MKTAALLLGFCTFALLPPTSLAGESDLAYLEYTIPEDAIKQGPRNTRDGQKSIRYLDATNRKVICEEIRSTRGVMRRRDLFKDGKKHGVQREWHEDGKKKLEAPYQNGLMHGVFRHWDEKGNLVGCYRMKDGSGTRRIYHSNGRLKEEQPYLEGKRHGRLVNMFDKGTTQYVCSWERGEPIGLAFGFHYNTGAISFVGNGDKDGELHGPAVDYHHKSGIEDASYYVHGKEVSAAAYRKACETDPTLPRYRKDPLEYRKLLTPEVRAVIKRYQQIEPVNIPLQVPAAWRNFLPPEPGEPDSAYLQYAIPKDAIKVGPTVRRDGRTQLRYLDKGTRQTLGVEVYSYKAKKLIKRTLLKNNKKHGVQREWREDGKKKLEEPYQNGLMHGVFRHWDEKGNLIGCYRMVKGTGMRRVYRSNGVLDEEQRFRDGLQHGLTCGQFENRNIRVLEWWKLGKLDGRAFGFHHDDGSLRFVIFYDMGSQHGPFVEYDHKRNLKMLVFCIRDKEVTAKVYEKACDTDPTLPRYRKDIQQYRKELTQDAKDIIARYKKHRPVNLPLQVPAEWRKLLPPEPGERRKPKPQSPAQAEGSLPAKATGSGNGLWIIIGAAAVGGLLGLLLLVVIRKRRSAA